MPDTSDTQAARLKAARITLTNAEWALANLNLSAHGKAAANKEADAARAEIEQIEATARIEDTP